MLKDRFKKNPFLYKCFTTWRSWSTYWKDDFNIYKTLYINLKAFPFRTAIKFPIFVFGKLKIYNLGIIKIDAPIHGGMIILGRNRDRFRASSGVAMIDNSGIILFKGSVRFSVDYSIYTQPTGVVEIGELTFFGNGVKIYCYNKISVGKCCRIGFESQLFDSGFHFTKNVETGEVKNILGITIIGNYCWIGNRSTITKGANMPDYTIVASNSLVNKNFLTVSPYPLLGGIPAKLISSGIVRIFNREDEGRLYEYFTEHRDATSIMDEPGLKDEYSLVKNEYIKL